MRLTPLDIHHKEFTHALRGYNEAEVDAFLDSVADELERLFKENIDLSERIDALDEKVRGYQDMERTLHNTLITAQRSADEIIAKASGEAVVVLKDAEVKAKEIIHGALTQKQKAVGDLMRIKQAEEEFRTRFRELLDTHSRSVSEIPLPEDVTLLTAEAGEEVVADVDVEAPEVLAAKPVVKAQETPAAVTLEPAGPIQEDTQLIAPPESGFVAGLHLGEVVEPEVEGEMPVFEAPSDFTLPNFGSYGERDVDTDIEEID
jgi:cell division initiation protein